MLEYINVVISDAALRHFRRIVHQCRRLGMRVTQQLPALGTFSGIVAADRIAALERIEGVVAVEPARSYVLAPPDSPVQ